MNIQTFAGSVILAGVAILSGCASGDSPPSGDIHPTHLSASVVSLLGPSYEVTMNGRNSVIYRHGAYRSAAEYRQIKEIVLVTDEQWREFRKSLDSSGVWQWKPEYRNAGVGPFDMTSDGTSWSLTVGYSDRSVQSQGNNAYPNQEDFAAFTRAVSKLVGGRVFR